MVFFKKNLNTKSDPNIHQNAPNCIILKKIFGGAYTRAPITNTWLCYALHRASGHANTPTFP